jgi:hypothetical protein
MDKREIRTADDMTDDEIETLRKELGINGSGVFALTREQYDALDDEGNQLPTSRCLPDPLKGSVEYEGAAALKTSLGWVRIYLGYLFDEGEMAQAAETDEDALPWDWNHEQNGRSFVAGW